MLHACDIFFLHFTRKRIKKKLYSYKLYENHFRTEKICIKYNNDYNNDVFLAKEIIINKALSFYYNKLLVGNLKKLFVTMIVVTHVKSEKDIIYFIHITHTNTLNNMHIISKKYRHYVQGEIIVKLHFVL